MQNHVIKNKDVSVNATSQLTTAASAPAAAAATLGFSSSSASLRWATTTSCVTLKNQTSCQVTVTAGLWG